MADDDRRAKRRQMQAEAVPLLRDRTRSLEKLGRNCDVTTVHKRLQEELKISKDYYPAVRKNLDGSRQDSKHLRQVLELGKIASKRHRIRQNEIDLRPSTNAKVTELGKSFEKFAKEYAVTVISRPSNFTKWFALGDSYLPPELRQQALHRRFGPGGDEPAPPRVKKSRKIVESENKSSATEKTSNEGEDNDMTSKQVIVIEQTLGRMTTERPINFYKALVDPDSFAKTVENIFHTSFLLKENKLDVKIDEESEDVPVITTKTASDSDITQSVLSFNMEDYKKWISKFEIREAAL